MRKSCFVQHFLITINYQRSNFDVSGPYCLPCVFVSARYRNQTSQAESYYRHAAQLVPSNGESDRIHSAAGVSTLNDLKPQ